MLLSLQLQGEDMTFDEYMNAATVTNDDADDYFEHLEDPDYVIATYTFPDGARLYDTADEIQYADEGDESFCDSFDDGVLRC